jgi:non-ribosomal peptide synthetase component F
MLRVVLEEEGLERCHRLRHVISSGEALAGESVRRFYERFDEQSGVQLHNLYGPTEAAIDVTYWRCERGAERESVPIGRPIANTQVYVLDKQGQPVAVGVRGELHIGGINLARGYWGRAGLTAEKFLPDEWSGEEGSRVYGTGDVCRYRADGSIEYVGRNDEQVKIRGFRIE